MGDIADYNDIVRFMRSKEGEARLSDYVTMLKGHKVLDVTYSNETSGIALTLHLDDGGTFVVYPPSLDLGVLRQEFDDVLQREYYIDYPERAPER